MKFSSLTTGCAAAEPGLRVDALMILRSARPHPPAKWTAKWAGLRPRRSRRGDRQIQAAHHHVAFLQTVDHFGVAPVGDAGLDGDGFEHGLLGTGGAAALYQQINR